MLTLATFETAMSVLGIPQREDAPDKSDAVVDFCLENPATNHIFFSDVHVITHPSFRNRHNHVKPLYAAEEAVQLKYRRYGDNYEVNKADIIPLVFDNYDCRDILHRDAPSTLSTPLLGNTGG